MAGHLELHRRPSFIEEASYDSNFYASDAALEEVGRVKHRLGRAAVNMSRDAA
jgi:hypothetical protein